MRIIKQFNSNAALALDASGKEVVVLGKGIGFHKVPYELTNLDRVERTFYDVNPQHVGMIANLPQSALMASADVVEQASFNLNCALNPNLPFTLADHLHFAMVRSQKGINLDAPLAYDVQHLYPEEYELGRLALDIVQDYTGVRLPEVEAVNIALHLINAETETEEPSSMVLLKVIGEVEEIVEKEFCFKLDKSSYAYNRFAMHLRYLVQRLNSGRQSQNQCDGMLRTLAKENPKIYTCALHIAGHLRTKYRWDCTEDEILYLMLHIGRVLEKQK